MRAQSSLGRARRHGAPSHDSRTRATIPPLPSPAGTKTGNLQENLFYVRPGPADSGGGYQLQFLARRRPGPGPIIAFRLSAKRGANSAEGISGVSGGDQNAIKPGAYSANPGAAIARLDDLQVAIFFLSQIGWQCVLSPKSPIEHWSSTNTTFGAQKAGKSRGRQRTRSQSPDVSKRGGR